MGAQDPNLPMLFQGHNGECRIAGVHSRVAQFQLYLNLLTGLFSALVSPKLGHLSDQYGRTKLIALAAFGTVLAEIVTVLVSAKPDSMSPNVLFLGAMLDGLGGSFMAAMALCHSYAADCSRPETRNVAFGYFNGALFVGIAAGPFLAAYIVEQTGSIFVIFVMALAFHASFFLACLFIIPESLPKEKQLAARERHQRKLAESTESSFHWVNPINFLRPALILLPKVGKPSVLFPNRRGASPALRRNLVSLALIDTILFGVSLGAGQMFIIYAEYMFDWGTAESSIFASIVNTVRVFTLFLLFPLATHFFSRPSNDDKFVPGSSMFDVVMIRISLAVDIVGHFGYVLAQNGFVMTISGAVSALGGIASPSVQSSLTKHVPHDRVGQMLGAVSLLHSLSRVVAPTIFTIIYSYTVGRFTQAVFVCFLVSYVFVFVLSLFVEPHGKFCAGFTTYPHAQGS